MSERPRCCPELRCTPLHLLAEGDGPGESFVCFGKAPGIGFTYDGVAHVNDLRSCHYSPLKGLIAFQENRDDWEALKAAYWRALAALDAAAEDESHYEAKGYHDERSDMSTQTEPAAYHDGVLYGIRHPGPSQEGCPFCASTLAQRDMIARWLGPTQEPEPTPIDDESALKLKPTPNDTPDAGLDWRDGLTALDALLDDCSQVGEGYQNYVRVSAVRDIVNAVRRYEDSTDESIRQALWEDGVVNDEPWTRGTPAEPTS